MRGISALLPTTRRTSTETHFLGENKGFAIEWTQLLPHQIQPHQVHFLVYASWGHINYLFSDDFLRYTAQHATQYTGEASVSKVGAFKLFPGMNCS